MLSHAAREKNHCDHFWAARPLWPFNRDKSLCSSGRTRKAQRGLLDHRDSFATTWVPLEAGLYKKHGLDVNLIYVAGSQAITTLISGDAQIAQASGAAGVVSRLAGSDVSIIGAIINVIPMSLVATPTSSTRRTLEARLWE